MAVVLEGMSQLLAQIEAMEQSIEGVVTEKALKRGAAVVKRGIEDTAPVKSGRLKANIVVSDIEINNGAEIHIGPDQQGKAFYGHFHEFGTSKMGATPFVRPGYENNKTEAVNEMADSIKGDLNL